MKNFLKRLCAGNPESGIGEVGELQQTNGNDASSITAENWREVLERQAVPLQVGGFRPTNDPLTTVFGDVRVALPGEEHPTLEGNPMWPLCQLNLTEAGFVPDALADVAMLAIFVSPGFNSDFTTRSDDALEQSEIRIRAYNSLDGLQAAPKLEHKSELKPFECKWLDPVPDYPNHDLLPLNLNFESFGLGGWYDQEGNTNIQATKIGGWPGTVQSEPWWDYRRNDDDFTYCLQIEGEPKAGWYFGDGAIFIARSRKDPNLWAIDVQIT